jgi:pyruvate/2-oxoacid:ferredoxin oxidoreductase alpha subunit
VKAGDKCSIVNIDLMVTLYGRICMIIKYAPGSLVTRRRTVLAASRLAADYQIPFVIVTNGEDAEIIDGSTGNIISHGLDSILSKPELIKNTADKDFKPISAKQITMESRIIYALEVDGSCQI